MSIKTIEKLRQLTKANVQNNWLSISEDIVPNFSSLSQGELMPSNDKGYMVWPAGQKVQWLAQKFTIPPHLQGYPIKGLTLRLALTWWAEDAQIFINGNLVQQGDLFDSSARVLLTPSANPGEEILVALRLVSPGHDIGALMGSQLIYERDPSFIVDDLLGETTTIDPGFVADELAILYNYLISFYPEQLNYFTEAIDQIDWNRVSDRIKFDQSLLNLRQTLHPLAKNIKQRTFNILGHAHLDMAWLWTIDETWEVAQRTFTSVINLQKDFPDLKFGHTSPVLYAWIEKHRPDLFQDIQAAYKAGKWEVLGGMWVEPEVNLVSGESLVRQLLYGQRYIQEKFGKITTVAWLPDSFGFSWQLPQIFHQAGIKYFVTGKLHWNNTTKFLHGVFWWESPDGTQLLTLMSPPNVTGVMDTSPITMTNYAIEWEQQTGLQEIFWIPGVGDHGGGPTRDMLEVNKRWQLSPFFPKTEFATAKNYLDKITAIGSKNLPVWNDELYLDLHRGCYTTHADQKYFNRRCEDLLYQAELWASLATIIEKNLSKIYPKEKLENAWKKMLFNQFHDILPGTSISEVFVDANKDWQEVETIGKEVLAGSLEAIASQITLPLPPQPDAKPLIVFNTLNWKRSEVIEISVVDSNWEIYDLDGNRLPSQLSEDNKLLFLAQDIPSIGYQTFWLSPENNIAKNINGFPLNEFILENHYLKVVVNQETGNLESIFDKINHREILQGIGNQLQSFQDQGQYWDAWNIDPDYNQYPLPDTELKSIEYLEFGSIQWRIRVIKQLGKSEFCQDYILQINSPILKIVTQVNWQETHVLVKASFPLNVEGNYTTYEIPFGAIKRTNFPQTPEEKAKWEVPALRWADLTDNFGNYGVSLLNDCKYGYDSQSDRLRLTLLRSPRWPDPNCDQGNHYFTYAIYPHVGSWQEAKTVQRGYELNSPLKVIIPDSNLTNKRSKLPSTGQFLKLPSDHLILSAFKVSENHSDTWILRCYECEGKPTEISLESDLGLKLEQPVNLLEQPVPNFSQVDPWKIVSFHVKFND